MARHTPEIAAEGLARVRHAYERSNQGDFSELVALFGPNTVWRGFERGRFWWRSAPS